MSKWNNYHEHWNTATSLEEAKYLVGSNSVSLRKAEREYMKIVGLKSHHVFLDLGCGCLRGTIDLVNYLDEKHFYGLDISEILIQFAKQYIKQEWFEDKKPILKVNTDFDINKYFPGIKFDYILAASLFTHLYPDDIKECIENISKVLNKNSSFYVTMFVLDEDNSNQYKGSIGWISHKMSWMRKIAEESGLKFEDIGKTIIGQHMVRFYK